MSVNPRRVDLRLRLLVANFSTRKLLLAVCRSNDIYVTRKLPFSSLDPTRVHFGEVLWVVNETIVNVVLGRVMLVIQVF